MNPFIIVGVEWKWEISDSSLQKKYASIDVIWHCIHMNWQNVYIAIYCCVAKILVFKSELYSLLQLYVSLLSEFFSEPYYALNSVKLHEQQHKCEFFLKMFEYLTKLLLKRRTKGLDLVFAKISCEYLCYVSWHSFSFLLSQSGNNLINWLRQTDVFVYFQYT